MIEATPAGYLRPQAAHVLGRSRVGLDDGVEPLIDECQDIGRLQHSGPVAWREVDGVQQGIQGCVHVHARRALRLVGREMVPMSLPVATLIGDDERVSAVALGYVIYPLENMLKAHLLRREIDRVGALRLARAQSRTAD